MSFDLRPYTRERLEKLHPKFQPLAQALLLCGQAIGLDIQVSCGYRSKAEQEALYSVGRTRPGKIVTNAKPGQSAHNFGLAVDVFFLTKDGRASFDARLYKKLWAAACEVGLDKRGLTWSGNWKTFKEMAHFELAGWRLLEEKEKNNV